MSTSFSLSALSQVFLSPQLRLTLSSISPANSASLPSVSTFTPSPQSPSGALRSNLGSASLPTSHHLSVSLGLSLSLVPVCGRRLTSPLPAPRYGCGCHIAARRAQRAADSAFPRPRLGARRREAVPAGSPRLWPTRTSTASPQSRAHNFLKDATGLGDGRGQPLPHSPKSRAQTRRSAVPRCAPCRAPPAHSPSAAPTTKASSVSMTALRTLRPAPGPPLL